jgi:hypothetical protein
VAAAPLGSELSRLDQTPAEAHLRRQFVDLLTDQLENLGMVSVLSSPIPSRTKTQ